jgi:hypothetical protein
MTIEFLPPDPRLNDKVEIVKFQSNGFRGNGGNGGTFSCDAGVDVESVSRERHTAADWAEGNSAGINLTAPPEWSDPDWSILDDRRGELPDFPIDTLSTECGEWTQRAAHGAGVTLDHVAVPLLGIVSSLIGTARRVMPSRSWSEPMTLWADIIGFSGDGKTPGINVTKRALAQVERDRRTKIADLQRAHETRVEAAKAARKKWKDEMEKAAEGAVVSLDKFRSTKGAEPPRLMPAEAVDPGPFVAPRLYISNTTIERLAVLLQARPQGMLLLADELAALFLNMSRYSGGTDAEFWLEAWCGGPYRVERMNRPSIDLDHLLVGLVGGLQPDKLARSFGGDLDGMYARVLFSWPPKAPYKPLTDEVAEVEPQIINMLNRIVNLEGGQDQDGGFTPRAVPLPQSAVAEFEQVRQFVAHQEQILEGRERDWIAKMPTQVLRLAGTLCYLDWAMQGGAEPQQIGLTFLQAAIRLVQGYFWPHARAALRQIGLTERHANARKVLKWIRATGKTEVSREDIRRDALGQALDADGTEQLIERSLVRTGWLRPVAARAGTRGKPARRWAVHPALSSTAQNAENGFAH